MTLAIVSLQDPEWRSTFVPDQKLYICTEGLPFPEPYVATSWSDLKQWLEAAVEDAEEIDADYEVVSCEEDFYKYYNRPLDGGEVALWNHYLAMDFLQAGYIKLHIMT